MVNFLPLTILDGSGLWSFVVLVNNQEASGDSGGFEASHTEVDPFLHAFGTSYHVLRSRGSSTVVI